VARLSSPVSLLFLSLLVLGAACEGPSPAGPALRFDPCAPLAIVADPDATETQQAAITAAIELWNEMALSRLALAVAPEPSARDAAVPIHFQRAGPPFYGLYDPGTGQLFINEALAGEGQIVTIAHEIGHAFGLEHVSGDDRVSVMNPGNLINEPTSADRDTLAIDWGYCH
jgi:hypothetical protein